MKKIIMAITLAVIGLRMVNAFELGSMSAKDIPAAEISVPVVNFTKNDSPVHSVHSAIAPYLQFLDSAKTDPVDYVMGLFEKADIVILCERFHPEVTQYDFIFRLVSDPRFINTVGRVFTEVGTNSFRPYYAEFLHAPDLSDDEINKRLSHIYQNFFWGAIWEKTNHYDFIRNVYNLNRSLPAGGKVDIIPSDVPFSWEGMSAEKYREFEQNILDNRDKIMADQIAKTFDGIQGSSDPRKKALVIMNYRHAFNKGENTGRYLFERYHDRVANVLINTVVPLPGSTDHNTVIGLIQDGKWEAAFAKAGNLSVGFNMQGSPFGEDEFDLSQYKNRTYKEAFTGFVFHVPLQAHKHISGTPGLVNENFAPVLMERFKIMGYGDIPLEDCILEVKKLATLKTHRYEDFDPNFDLQKLLKKWLDEVPEQN